MASILQYLGQAFAYLLIAVFIGYFATQPAYTYFDLLIRKYIVLQKPVSQG